MSRIRLKVLNSTDYSTRDLRRLFLAGMRAIGAEQPKTLVVRYKRRPPTWKRKSIDYYLGGLALIGQRPKPWPGSEHSTPLIEGARVWLKLPRDGEASDHVDALARIIMHELWHSLGWHHREMPPDERMPIDWAEGMTLAFKGRETPRLEGEIAAGSVEVQGKED